MAAYFADSDSEDELPPGWEERATSDGCVYYVKFDGSSTALQVLHGRDLSGKVAVVTGANCGIGFETARSLALHGCHVVLACRSSSAAQAALLKISQERPDAKLLFMELILDKLDSVKSFVNQFSIKFEKLDILILNAGVFGVPYSTTVDGYELLFQVNHLSQAYLTLLLEDKLTRGVPSRVVFVSSESHRYSSLTSTNFSDDIVCPKDASAYWSMMAYNHSKLMNVIFAGKLSEKWAAKGIAVFSLHPGNMIYSDISRYWWFYRMIFAFVRPFTKSLQQGASTTIYCASAPELDSVTGLYFNNCFRTEPSKAAQDPILGNKVWDLTREMILRTGHNIDM